MHLPSKPSSPTQPVAMQLTDTPAPTDTDMHVTPTMPQPPSTMPQPSLTEASVPAQPPPAPEFADGKRRRVETPSPPSTPPPPTSLDQVADQLATVLNTVAGSISTLQWADDDTSPITQRQARCFLDVFTTGLATLIETMRLLRSHPPPHPSPLLDSNPHAQTTTDLPPTPDIPTAPPPTVMPGFPPLSREPLPMAGPPRTDRTPVNVHPSPLGRRVLSYADRLRSQHHSSDGESRRQLAGRILAAPPPMHRRLLPLTREPQARLNTELEKVRVVYVRGLLRMSFREMRGYLRDLSPVLTPRSLLSISYFGPITSFICLDATTATALSDTLTQIGGRVDHSFCPWMPLRRDQQDDDTAKQRAEDVFCHRIAGEITSSPNLLLTTFLQRQLAPHLAPTISALVRGSQTKPTAATPPPPGANIPGVGPRRSPTPTHTSATHPPPSSVPLAPPAPPTVSPPQHTSLRTATAAGAVCPAPAGDASPDSSPNAAHAASTSAPAEHGVVAEGTA